MTGSTNLYRTNPDRMKSDRPAGIVKVQACIAYAAALLTPRRLRVQAIILALCLWVVCLVDFSTPGPLDRAGNIKFQDFLPIYVSARIIVEDHAAELYNQAAVAREIQAIVGQPIRARLPFLYGPQVGLLFSPLSRFSFQTAAWAWVALSVAIFFACIFLVWRCCPTLSSYSALVAGSALAYPPLFHFFVRGQISVLPLACFTAAFLAFRARRDSLAGVLLGILVFKPQFLVAIPLVLLFSRAWRSLSSLALSAAAQFLLTRLYFGPAVMHSYFDMLWHIPRWISSAELSLAPIQMHSLSSFWTLLIPWPNFALGLYVLSSIVIIGMAAIAWRSSSPLALRFSVLTLAAVLVNPHLFIYDLLMLAPAFPLVADWSLGKVSSSSSLIRVPSIRVLLYLAFLTPVLGPLSQWTRVQLSVPVFVALLWILSKNCPLITRPSPASHNPVPTRSS